MSNRRIKITKMNSTVSIITITQLKRKECLLNLYELIKLQTYKNIKEWIIVEGSVNEIDANENKINIDNLKILNDTNIDIVYIEYSSNKKLSDLRNIGNNKCSSDIIVCMDDDDYYPPLRVEHAVESLEKSSALIAGCSDIYLYEYFMNKLYKFKGFHNNHSTNNCMAFKKSYLLNHKHDSGLIMSEEKSFTNNFTEPMVQLTASKCIIVSSHDLNTFNKREICIGGSYGTNPSLSEVTDHPIETYIPKNIFIRMKNIFFKEKDSEYDIVYYTGGFGTKWDPKDNSLGGSEQAIVHLCNQWTLKGLNVAVYGDFKKDETVNNVKYINWKLFPFNHKFKTVILWRTYGFMCGAPFNIKTNNLHWDIHDNFANKEDLIIPCYNKYKNTITKILLKSNYHLSEFEKYFETKLNNSQYTIIPNGLKIDKFNYNWDNVVRNPYRFCYVSYYTRGLQHIIPCIFSYIKELEPRAELHLYYGMEMFTDENLKNQLKNLTCYPGVIDHGRQSTEMIVREKYHSSFQLYITNTISEIDCISIRESLIAGCIPLISTFGVFNEREGIHFNLNDTDQENMKEIALNIIKLMQNQKQLDILRNVFKKSHTIQSWEDIANKHLLIV